MEKGRKAPDRAPVLEATWLKVIDSVIEKTHLSEEQVFLSGKSMGGRYASIIASKQNYAGIILYGYPLHAPGKPLNLRIEHFKEISCPILIFQGTRDSLCHLNKCQESLKKYAPNSSLYIIEGGDHSFKTLKRQNRTEESVWQEIAKVTVEWIQKWQISN
jgi:predicted alpha/beta-hydrolase family hydrolase